MINKLTKKILSLTAVLLCLSITICQAQNKVSGQVLDAATSESLVGANVVIKGTTSGASTDIDGKFEIVSKQAFPWTLDISYIGYTSQTITVTNETSSLKIMLDEGILGEEVVISASRRAEKVQEAPASISVLSAKKIESSAQAADPARNLINTPGVQIQQQGAGRINIEMRGQAGIFNTQIFPIKDYRSLIGAGVGTFDSNNVGLSNIDLEKIEVVRGPGSALYGPGVAAGVIHFITKNPIDHQGVAVEFFGGEKATVGGAVRYAQATKSKKFGWKLNAGYKRGDEFTLDGSEGTTSAAGIFTSQIDKFQSTVFQPLVENGVVNGAVRGDTLLINEADELGNYMQDYWWAASGDVTLEFRPSDKLSITLANGLSQSSSIFYNQQGEGLAQNREFWHQLRVQAGGLFAQFYVVNNDGGTRDRPTFLYQTGNRTPVGRQQYEAQAQYNIESPKLLNANWTIGADYRLLKQDTENLVYGRNEADDDYSIIGAYVQGKLPVAKKLDIVVAGRYDKFNVFDKGVFSPRAAIVFKPSIKHTVRASYNRSSNTPSNLRLQIDFPLATVVPGLFDIWVKGSKDPYTFENGVIDITIPGVPDLPVGTPGLPLAIAYGGVTPAVLAGLEAALPDAQYALIANALDGYTPSGVSGSFAQYNLLNGSALTAIEEGSGQINIIDTWEVGYKGLIADKVSLMVDVYNNTSRDLNYFSAISPTYSLVDQNIAADLSSTVQSDLNAILIEQGLDAATAGALSAAVGGAYQAGGEGFVEQTSALYGIIGVQETDQAPVDDIAHVIAGYRTFGKINYWGADLGAKYYIMDDLSAFFNYSWLSQTVFEGEDLGEPADSPLRYALNVPDNKFRLGVEYTPDVGVRGSISFQHDPSFFGDFGQYVGDTDKKNLVDMSVGYKLDNGLAFDVSATNLFNTKYRPFPNFPQIGRRVLVKVAYNFGFNKKDN